LNLSKGRNLAETAMKIELMLPDYDLNVGMQYSNILVFIF